MHNFKHARPLWDGTWWQDPGPLLAEGMICCSFYIGQCVLARIQGTCTDLFSGYVGPQKHRNASFCETMQLTSQSLFGSSGGCAACSDRIPIVTNMPVGSSSRIASSRLMSDSGKCSAVKYPVEIHAAMNALFGLSTCREDRHTWLFLVCLWVVANNCAMSSPMSQVAAQKNFKSSAPHTLIQARKVRSGNVSLNAFGRSGWPLALIGIRS